MTVEAFNIAERYQTPVILLSDQEIAQRKETVDPIDTSRFVIEERKLPDRDRARRTTSASASPRTASARSATPACAGGNYQGAGIEHNEHGNPTASGKMHAAMNEKRFRKLAPLKRRAGSVPHRGDDRARGSALVAWGSIAGVCREAFERAKAEGLDVKLLVPWLVYPVAEEIYRDFFASVRAGLVVELSHQGQLYRILRMFIGRAGGRHVVLPQRGQPASSRARSSRSCARPPSRCKNPPISDRLGGLNRE